MGGITYTSTKVCPIYSQKSPIYPQKSSIPPRVQSDHGRYHIYLHKSAPINPPKSPIFPQKSRIPGISRQFHCRWQLPRKLANTRSVRSWEVSHIQPQKCALCICKRALHTRKRALYTRKSALFLVIHGSCHQGANTDHGRDRKKFRNSALYFRKSALYICQRALYIRKRALYMELEGKHA